MCERYISLIKILYRMLIFGRSILKKEFMYKNVGSFIKL